VKNLSGVVAPSTARVGNGKKFRGACFAGEKSLETEMVRNGWAILDHEAKEAWEIIARENGRGLWRDKFVEPKRWRKGKRLPGSKGMSELGS